MALTLAAQIEHALSAGVTGAGDLAAKLKVSQPSISRGIAELTRTNRIVRMGTTRGARYGLRRTIVDTGSTWPIYRVGVAGEVEQIAALHALAADEFLVEPQANLNLRRVGGLRQGLPYYLQDQRPGGFLGRAVPRQFPELHLPQRVNDWNDDHYLRYFTRHGGSAVGNLVLGEAALNEMLAARTQQTVIALVQREQRYAELAELAMIGGMPGSSAHGEHPKFATAVASAAGAGSDDIQHVLVKFSPPRNSDIGARWSDLLTAEHVAHRTIDAHATQTGLTACRSELLFFGERAYLEIRRFDRHGAFGRLGVTSLFAIDAEYYGRLDSWTSAGARLFADNLIDASTLTQLRLATAFGALIGNTDRHFGNVAFLDDYSSAFKLAPVYDMLPMLLAPEHGQVIEREFAAPPVTADTLDVWTQARTMAVEYWSTLTGDDRVSKNFRAIAARCAKTIESLSR
jgi:hypothetical protein